MIRSDKLLNNPHGNRIVQTETLVFSKEGIGCISPRAELYQHHSYRLGDPSSAQAIGGIRQG